jgi:NAD(P)-dependent dehydrogenase (short-subunit alcohol dehydrogenase family)
VAPGEIRAATNSSEGKEITDQSAATHLLTGIGDVADIAEMVYAVAKNRFINGAIINVDGGLGAAYSPA